MGQLIKLQDYVSRYEQNIFLYPARYVRLKKQHWEKVVFAWENHEGEFSEQQDDTSALDWFEEDSPTFFEKIKGALKIRKRHEANKEEVELEGDDGLQEEESAVLFQPIFAVRPQTKLELKQQFLDQLIRFQLKWASSTLMEKSYVDNSYLFDRKLAYFLQRFPDTYLIMYRPIFLLKKAPVEVESIMITPTEVLCITFLEEEDQAVYIGSKERFWMKRVQNQEKKILNPLLALNRTHKIVQTLFKKYDIELPIHQVMISRNGYIDYPSAPYGTFLVEKRNYEEWFQSLRNNRSPLKHVQLKAAKALLQFCQTSSFKRHEWESEDESNQDDLI
ncbi:nuclease-related domain-containing protein [Cytobacillus sp. Hz8]|uniref:nuclease-related domain-containing protein n=1 Tax=Cytobacillus sp. Hz8 TaxID=3347168 RepID=UPI0035DC51F5